MAERDRRRTSRRGARAVAAFACSVVVAVTTTTGLVGANPVPRITVTETPTWLELGACSPGTSGLGYEVLNARGSFTLRVFAATSPCAPIAAVAVVYAMPGGGVAWPQSLRERRQFTIDRAGTTDIRFAKGCEPSQFDVITGDSPATIAPWAEWHGPLLFPSDVGTSLQHQPRGDCEAPSTTGPSTSAPTPTTSTPTSPTTSAPPGATTEVPTTAPPDTASVVPEVLESVQTRATTPGAPAPQDTAAATTDSPTVVAGLALTGTSARILAGSGLLVTAVGLAMLAISGRRRADW